jgi:kindlin 2
LTIPSLTDHLSYMRPKRFTLKGYKRNYFVLRELQLTAYRSKNDTLGIGGHGPTFSVNLKGCEVTPCVNITHQKYAIRLAIPSPDGMSDLWIKCESVSAANHKTIGQLLGTTVEQP